MELYHKYETKILTENEIDIQNDGTKEIIRMVRSKQGIAAAY